MKYLKSPNGYYYKLLKNEKKKRISKEEYMKKISKQKGGVETISPEDIMYQDEDVTILRPEVKKGILVYNRFDIKKNLDLCTMGIKTQRRLREEGINIGRSKNHPYIFFRAPFKKSVIDYSNVDTEIASSYEDDVNSFERRMTYKWNGTKDSGLAWIRVDPQNTFVYSSDLRAKGLNNSIMGSRIRMTDYLNIIEDNQRLIDERLKSRQGIYPISFDLFTYRLVGFHEPRVSHHSNRNVNRDSEVLVRIPHLTPDYFVKCI